MTDTVGGSLGDSSLLVHKAQSTFDVRDESQVIALLKLIHQSALDPDVKNHLRDLIFNFRQSQTKDSLRWLGEALTQLGVKMQSFDTNNHDIHETPEHMSEPTIAHALQRVGSFGALRPRPRFVGLGSSDTLKESIQTDTSVLQPPVLSAQNQQPQSEPIPKRDLQEHPSQPTGPKETQSAVPEPVIRAHGDASTRIKEIKKMVNEKIGNPINLIDSDNAVGREYMNSLLDAMKKSNGGLPQELDVAMDRLEKAFVQVQEVIFNGSKPSVAEPIPQQLESVSKEVRRSPQESVLENKTLQSESTLSHGVSPVVQPIIQTNATPRIIKVNTQHTSSIGLTELSSVQTEEAVPEVVSPFQSEKIIEATPIAQSPHVVSEVEPTIHQEPLRPIPAMDITRVQSAPQPMPEQKATVPQTDQQPTAHSVAKEKQLQDLMRANREKEVTISKQQEAARVAAMDPLLTPEVDAGLHQLLSEWGLFKSSGIFGTGPGGQEHALYKKLAPLPMAAVIAGRFEGATPKIKQGITDTMNGWRYEDGILYEPSETFERYLRKVIRNILDRQKHR